MDTSSFAAKTNQVSFSVDMRRGATLCVHAEDDASMIKDARVPEHRRMRALLREVAERGYTPCLDEDPRVKLGSERNLLAVVIDTAMASHIPPEAFSGDTMSLAVAASQAARVLLALELRSFERRQCGAGAATSNPSGAAAAATRTCAGAEAET